jgi:hypothetical protein
VDGHPGGDAVEYLEDVCPTPDGGCVAVGRTNTPPATTTPGPCA